MPTMPRIVRGLGDNFIYRVIQRGITRQEVLHREKDYEAFVKLIEETKERDVPILNNNQRSKG